MVYFLENKEIDYCESLDKIDNNGDLVNIQAIMKIGRKIILRWYSMEDKYICKIASLEEMNKKWDYEIENRKNDRNNWIMWKKMAIENFIQGKSIPYYGILNGNIICEATACVVPEIVQNRELLVGNNIAYLSSFRTNLKYQGKGYFSKLFKFMLNDLKEKGYKKVTLGVELSEEENKKIYNHYGFTEYIKSATEIYPDGTVIEVSYYGKNI